MTRFSVRTLVATTAVIVGVATASVASAATVSINQTLDLTKAATSLSSPQLQAIGTGFSPAVDFNLAVGDTLDYNLDFLGDQSLHATNLFFIKAAFFSCCDSQLIGATGNLTLFDDTHTAVFTSGPNTNPVGNSFGQDFLISVPNITFSSLEYVAHVDSYSPFGPGTADTTREYTTPLFQAGVQNSGSLNILGAVPEPSTWAMMLTGFLGLGAMLRRRRALATA